MAKVFELDIYTLKDVAICEECANKHITQNALTEALPGIWFSKLSNITICETNFDSVDADVCHLCQKPLN